MKLVRILGQGLRVVAFSAAVVLGGVAMWVRADDVFLEGGKVAFLDPDCYARMKRVEMVMDGEGPSIRFHSFENAPYGVVPHTTMPMDFLIYLLVVSIGGVGVPGALDLAGAVASPVLGIMFLGVVAIWAWRRDFGWAGLMLVASSPILTHGFSVGRPDHQSLIIFLYAMGLMFEMEIWRGKAWACWLAAVVWGLACWTSLYEPLILLGCCLGMRALVKGPVALPRTLGGWGAFVLFFGVLGGAIFLDGWRSPGFQNLDAERLKSWWSTIGEMSGVGINEVLGWAGWLVVVAPLGLLVGGIFGRDREMVAGAILVGGLLFMTLGMSRWGYFLVLGLALFLPMFFRLLPWKVLGFFVFILSLWPVAGAWERQLFPEGNQLALQREQRLESILLMEVAERMKEGGGGNFLAPWWVSPALSYWSGLGGVAGSSHQSLPGIVDTARFFLEKEDRGERALEILRSRGVKWVVVDDPERVVRTSELLLGQEESGKRVAEALFRGQVVEGLVKVFENQFFRLYRVVEY